MHFPPYFTGMRYLLISFMIIITIYMPFMFKNINAETYELESNDPMQNMMSNMRGLFEKSSNKANEAEGRFSSGLLNILSNFRMKSQQNNPLNDILYRSESDMKLRQMLHYWIELYHKSLREFQTAKQNTEQLSLITKCLHRIQSIKTNAIAADLTGFLHFMINGFHSGFTAHQILHMQDINFSPKDIEQLCEDYILHKIVVHWPN